jgi:hypothetical protein
VSVGAVLAEAAATEGSDLIRKADITMYRAKAEARNCYRIFSDEMDADVQRRNLIQTKLRQALQDGTGLELTISRSSPATARWWPSKDCCDGRIRSSARSRLRK